jgi:perosamine synthetase
MGEMDTGNDAFVMPIRQYPSLEFVRWAGRKEPRPEGGTSRSYQFLLARNAIYHGLAALGIGAGDRVLVPAYLCIAAVKPVMALGATVDFHDVRDDCSVDVGALERKIQPRTRAVMCVHYFGFPQRLDALRELCNRHRLVLLEDCAHVLPRAGGEPTLGRVGELAVFSWPKLLPVDDGATLIVNVPERPVAVRWQRETALHTLQVAKDLCDRTMTWTEWTKVNAVYKWLQRPKALLRRGGARPAVAGAAEECRWFERSRLNLPMSRPSRWLLAHADVEAIRQRRREHYQFVSKHTQDVMGARALFPRLEEGVCPWVYPMLFEGRPKAHLDLRRLGIPAVAWDGVRPPDISREQFPRADFLYDNLVMLPVHQNLRRRDLELIVEGIRRVAGAGRTA